MTPAEKLINAIREGLIEKHGANFLKLSEDQQNEMIVASMTEYIDELKSEK